MDEGMEPIDMIGGDGQARVLIDHLEASGSHHRDECAT
jgi:hypothetical protein